MYSKGKLVHEDDEDVFYLLISNKRGGRETVVPGVEIHKCPDCHERLFSPEAINHIAAVAVGKLKQTG